MRRPAALILIASLLCIPTAPPVFGGQFEDAKAAYERGDYATAYRLSKPLAEQGNAEAQHNVGMMYLLGKGVPEDATEAMKWLHKAAEQGIALSQSFLGLGYMSGLGVSKDPEEAVKWLRKAAEQGNVDAQKNLGVSYYKGEGVKQDYLLAYFWLSLAVTSTKGKRTDIVKARDTAAKKLTPEQLEKGEQMVKEWKPKKEGK